MSLIRSEVLQLLPFVLKLESKDQVKTAFARLLSGAAAAAGGVAAGAGGEIDRVTAVDLLEAIIRVERDNRENLPIKRISDALDCCFELRDKIDTKVRHTHTHREREGERESCHSFVCLV